jgi:hypothetical protein
MFEGQHAELMQRHTYVRGWVDGRRLSCLWYARFHHESSTAAAKGREWQAVFLLGMTEGELPRENEFADRSNTEPLDT